MILRFLHLLYDGENEMNTFIHCLRKNPQEIHPLIFVSDSLFLFMIDLKPDYSLIAREFSS